MPDYSYLTKRYNMGLFDFFKGKSSKLTSEQTKELILFAMNELLKEGTRYDQVIQAVRQKGCSDKEADVIVQEAVRLKRRHLSGTTTNQQSAPKSTTTTKTVVSPVPGLYAKLRPYSAYIIQFLNLQSSGDYAPIGAYCTPDGNVTGFVFIYNEENSYVLAVDEAVRKMTQRFNARLHAGEIASWVILYHSQYTQGSNTHLIAEQQHELKAVTIAYRFSGEEISRIAIPYTFESDSVSYSMVAEFSQEENNSLFGTTLIPDHNYFADREIIQAPEYTTSDGITVQQSNSRDLYHSWGGIVGFQRANQPDFHHLLKEYTALTLFQGKEKTVGNVTINSLKAGNIWLKTYMVEKAYKTCMPIMKTNIVTPVVVKSIEEWEQTGNTIAILTGSGKDTFGLKLILSDYIEHKSRYHSKKSLPLQISAIAFVMDTSDSTFTAYLPSSHLPGHACFDFMGVVLQYRPAQVFPEAPISGYQLTVRLVTHPDDPDMFNVDMYVAKENMRFDQLHTGMKISGMLQFMAELAVE